MDTWIDVAWWFQRGKDDGERDRPPIFRHARRNSGGMVTAIGDEFDSFGSAEREHEAGTAYLSGYASGEEGRAA